MTVYHVYSRSTSILGSESPVSLMGVIVIHLYFTIYKISNKYLIEIRILSRTNYDKKKWDKLIFFKDYFFEIQKKWV